MQFGYVAKGGGALACARTRAEIAVYAGVVAELAGDAALDILLDETGTLKDLIIHWRWRSLDREARPPEP